MTLTTLLQVLGAISFGSIITLLLSQKFTVNQKMKETMLSKLEESIQIIDRIRRKEYHSIIQFESFFSGNISHAEASKAGITHFNPDDYAASFSRLTVLLRIYYPAVMDDFIDYQSKRRVLFEYCIDQNAIEQRDHSSFVEKEKNLDKSYGKLLKKLVEQAGPYVRIK